MESGTNGNVQILIEFNQTEGTMNIKATRMLIIFVLVNMLFHITNAYAYVDEDIELGNGVKIITQYDTTLILMEDNSLWSVSSDTNELKKVMDHVKDVFGNTKEDVFNNKGYGVFAVIKTDGTLWTIGFGLGAVSEKIMDDVIFCAPGSKHSLAIKSDGSLWAWGDNYYGQLGNGTTQDSDIPVEVLDHVKYASVNECASYAIKEDNTLWAFGMPIYLNYSSNFWPRKYYDDVKAQNGLMVLKNNGELLYRDDKISDDVKYMSSGSSFCVFVKNDKTLWTFGINERGELGNGKTGETFDMVPTKIMEDVADFSTGTNHTLAIKTDGTLWGFGSNYSRQLSTSIEEKPIVSPFMISTGILKAIGTERYSIILRKDGSLYMIGNEKPNQIDIGIKINIPPNKVNIVLDNQQIDFKSTGAFIDKNGRIQIPVRYIAEAMGATVDWDDVSKKITITSINKTIVFILENKEYTINGENKSMDTVATIVSARTFVPIRFLVEALGATVEWDKNTNTAKISTLK